MKTEFFLYICKIIFSMSSSRSCPRQDQGRSQDQGQNHPQGQGQSLVKVMSKVTIVVVVKVNVCVCGCMCFWLRQRFVCLQRRWRRLPDSFANIYRSSTIRIEARRES